ncbi:oxygen-independent coproporphyrinogen III oxidase [Burkholderia pseudomallei]|uniref:oxygen-independent coproporphyrinogen III oxidase n=1 Tax=Burkholderia pseudomallei TaxID=28450 RepID=UPI000F058806|nr:oxygen-independent coproporphyrinogen III oxidase [Burkholderia pseudomallei]VBU52272.1 coproporphyrinogen III oxidase [Burkholderia pseudomallei]
MTQPIPSEALFRPDLLAKYTANGPRYTSYPTAPQFRDDFDPADYIRAAADPGASASELSLYFHIPFCATACFYCGCNKIATRNRKRARPYLDQLKHEIALQAALFDPERTVTQLHWGGGTPTFLSNAETTELMAATREYFTLASDRTGEFSIEIDPRTASPATLVHLRTIGFNRVSLGVQDFDPDVQRAINRVQPLKMTSDLVRAARATGYHSIGIDLIYGLPHQTVSSFARTLDTIVELEPDRLSVFGYAHLPHLFKMQRQIDAAALPPPATRIALLGLAIERLTRAGYVYIGMDHFARPGDELVRAQRNGTLQRNFQGYSKRADADLIGIGASSIGKVGDVYAQNAKDLPRYGAALADQRLPIARGVKLSADDRLRRDVITHLMCNLVLPFSHVEAAYGIRFANKFARELDTLRGFERDGLLSIGADRLTIHPAGRLYVRNIAMVFDAYLSGASEHRYSKTV